MPLSRAEIEQRARTVRSLSEAGELPPIVDVDNKSADDPIFGHQEWMAGGPDFANVDRDGRKVLEMLTVPSGNRREGDPRAQRSLQLFFKLEKVEKARTLAAAVDIAISEVPQLNPGRGAKPVALMVNDDEQDLSKTRGDWMANGFKEALHRRTEILYLSFEGRTPELRVATERVYLGTRKVLDEQFATVGMILTDEEWALRTERTDEVIKPAALAKRFEGLTPERLRDSLAEMLGC